MIDQDIEDQCTNQDSNIDENAIENLKIEVCLNNHQLLELTYNDQKFYEKLKEFNHFGCLYIEKQSFLEASIYLNQAQKVLQYAASCGKTIERNFIITTLNNQAALYQRAWDIQKAESYLQAIIYNISTFFQSNSDQQEEKPCIFSKNILNENSPEYEEFSISLWRKKSLAIYYLQFCALNSQNKNHENAFASAFKAVALLKEICRSCYEYQTHLSQAQQHQKIQQQNEEFDKSKQDKQLLYQLATIKPLNTHEMQFQQIYNKTIRYIAVYLKRLQNQHRYSQNFLDTYRKNFQNYSIGSLMQISFMQLQERSDKVNIKSQIQVIQKHYKAIYLSVGHFILATEGRFISTQKYTLDENQRKCSLQYKQSQIYHLLSIIIVTKYLICQSGYFDHVVNSFRNHYKLDLMQDAKKYFESNPHMDHQDLIKEQGIFCDSDHSLHDIKLKNLQTQFIQKQQSELKTAQQIQDIAKKQGYERFDLKTEESEEKMADAMIKNINQEKGVNSAKNSKNQQNQNTARKKNHSKKLSNLLTKSQTRFQNHENNKIAVTTQQDQLKLNPKTINFVTSKEKQNKQKVNGVMVKSSRSKKKSEYHFFQSNKKINIVNGAVPKKSEKSSKQETIYYKRESQYLDKAKSRSKSKRAPTSNQTERKMIRRKDSCGDLRKTKKVEQQYGVNYYLLKQPGQNKQDIKTSRNQVPNAQNLKKSKNRKQSEEKVIKLTSPQIKMKKLKSPTKIKKT